MGSLDHLCILSFANTISEHDDLCWLGLLVGDKRLEVGLDHPGHPVNDLPYLSARRCHEGGLNVLGSSLESDALLILVVFTVDRGHSDGNRRLDRSGVPTSSSRRMSNLI